VPGFKNTCIVEKQLHNGMCRKKELLLPADTDQIWFHCLHIHSKLSQTLQLST